MGESLVFGVSDRQLRRTLRQLALRSCMPTKAIADQV
jgi:hypothetical protein